MRPDDSPAASPQARSAALYRFGPRACPETESRPVTVPNFRSPERVAATLASTIQTRPIPEFDGIADIWPRGDRLEAVRDAAVRFKGRFRAQGQITAARAIPIATAAYPLKFAFQGMAIGPNPYVSIVNRMIVIEYNDFDGNARVLVWEPTAPEGSREAPFYAQQIAKYGEKVLERLFAEYFNTVPEGLAQCGLRPEDVDVAAFDHLHVQDPSMIFGTQGAVGQEAHEPMMPNAVHIAQRVEVDTFLSLHPMQWAWYVADGWKDIRQDTLLLVDGDVELGPGLAIISTPGHTDGNQSLVINTPDGVWVSSENGVSLDNWQPELSQIPGVRSSAAFFRREVVMNANTLEDSIDQYDSMIKEKILADRCPRDPRFLQVLPSSEMPVRKRQWPVTPTYYHGDDALRYGAFTRGQR